MPYTEICYDDGMLGIDYSIEEGRPSLTQVYLLGKHGGVLNTDRLMLVSVDEKIKVLTDHLQELLLQHCAHNPELLEEVNDYKYNRAS